MEVTFKTAKDTLGWEPVPGQDLRREMTTYRPPHRPGLALLTAVAVRAAMTGAHDLPDAPAITATTAGQDTASADLHIYPHGAPLPVTGGLPCPPRHPAVELSAAEAARIERLTRNYAAGLLTAPALPPISAGHTGDAATGPAAAGTTTAPASRPSRPDP